MTVLIIDDDPGYTMLIELALREFADVILKAMTWDEADPLLSQNPDVAWVDLVVPPDGVQQSLQRIRQLREQNVQIVIVISSGYIEQSVAAQLDEIGVDAIMAKGQRFEPGQVAALVVLGMIKAEGRGVTRNREYLTKATDLMQKRFPKIMIPV